MKLLDGNAMDLATSPCVNFKCGNLFFDFLIINGDNDKYYPVDIPVEMYKSIPNSHLWIIPNGGHLPIWKELWSDQFLKVSKLFLADKFCFQEKKYE